MMRTIVLLCALLVVWCTAQEATPAATPPIAPASPSEPVAAPPVVIPAETQVTPSRDPAAGVAPATPGEIPNFFAPRTGPPADALQPTVVPPPVAGVGQGGPGQPPNV